MAALGLALLLGVLLARPGRPRSTPPPAPPPSARPRKAAAPVPASPSPAAGVTNVAGTNITAAVTGRVATAASADPEAVDVAALKAEAIELAAKMRRAFPDQVGPLVLSADVHRLLGESREAAKWYGRCLEKDPGRVDVQLGLGRMELTKGNPAAALEHFDAAAAIKATAPRIQYSRGLALLNLGRVKEARAAFERELAAGAPDALVYHFLGQACLQDGDAKAARAAFEKAVELAPEMWNAHYGLATACARLGLREEAARHRATFKTLKARDLQQTIAGEIERDDRRSVAEVVADAWSRAGDICLANGRLAEARRHWLRAAELDPAATACRERLAAQSAAEGRFAEAVTRYEELRRLAPDNPNHVVALGMLQLQQGHREAAAGLFRAAIQMAPKRSVGYQAMARLELAPPVNLTEARRWAEAAVAHEPDAPGWFLLAQVRDKSGDRPGAIAAVEKALALDPENSTYQRVHALLQQQP